MSQLFFVTNGWIFQILGFFFSFVMTVTLDVEVIGRSKQRENRIFSQDCLKSFLARTCSLNLNKKEKFYQKTKSRCRTNLSKSRVFTSTTIDAFELALLAGKSSRLIGFNSIFHREKLAPGNWKKDPVCDLRFEIWHFPFLVPSPYATAT